MSITFKPKCLVCEQRFNPNWEDTRIVYYFRPVQFCEVCPNCQSYWEICEYCGEFHWRNDPNDTPICEPIDPGLKEL